MFEIIQFRFHFPNCIDRFVRIGQCNTILSHPFQFLFPILSHLVIRLFIEICSNFCSHCPVQQNWIASAHFCRHKIYVYPFAIHTTAQYHTMLCSCFDIDRTISMFQTNWFFFLLLFSHFDFNILLFLMRLFHGTPILCVFCSINQFISYENSIPGTKQSFVSKPKSNEKSKGFNYNFILLCIM